MPLGDLELPTVELIADWVETVLLVGDAATLGFDKLFSLAEAELGIEPVRASMAVQVIARRSSTLGRFYPFDVLETVAVRLNRAHRLTDAYSSLLFLTPCSPARQLLPQLSIQEMGERLEEIAQRALANLWGQGGRALRFGFPSSCGRPERFDQAVPWLAAQIGIEPGRGFRPPRRKDGGVDVVAWHQFMDRRPGFPIALAQCTIQAEAFTKTTDIDVRLWATWLAMDADPLSVLVLPGTIRREGPEWRQLTSVVTVIERLRLMELLGRGDDADVTYPWSADLLTQLRNGLFVCEA